MGYAALGSALAGTLALWLLGSYRADGFAWSSRPAALVTVVVVGPVMLLAYLLLLRLFRVNELRDLLRPLLGRLGRGGVPAASPESATAARATVSDDTGLIPRISGEFDAASFRAGPDLSSFGPSGGQEPEDEHTGWTRPARSYLPEEDEAAGARGSLFRGSQLRRDVPLPGRRTRQGPADGPSRRGRKRGRRE